MKIYIYGAHVKLGYFIEVQSFEEIPCKVKSKGQDMLSLVKGHRWRSQSGLPKDECGGVRQADLQQFGEQVTGTARAEGTICRVSLMNDEVLWQWRTGSVLTYRFASKENSLAFYCFLLGANVEVKLMESNYLINVGDYVRFKQDVKVKALAEHTYLKDEVVRVFDANEKDFVVSPEDEKTYFRIPGAGGSKIWVAYAWIPLELVEKVECPFKD